MQLKLLLPFRGAIGILLFMGRRFVAYAGILFLAVCLTLAKSEAAALRPNVILISIDTLAADHMGLHGYFRDTTPFLTKFAGENVMFENTFSQAAYTLPSHMSMFTGLYVDTHKIFTRMPLTTLDLKYLTLAQVLKANGYKTVWMATTRDPHLSPSRGLGRGFDELHDVDFEMGKGLTHVKSLLGKLKTKPFFLFLHTYMVHDPYHPIAPYDRIYVPSNYPKVVVDKDKLFKLTPFIPAPIEPDLSLYVQRYLHARINFFKQFDRGDPGAMAHMAALYDGGIRTADDAMKEVFATFKKLGLYENSLIVVTSDHGEAFNQHGYYGHFRPTYEEIHVPLIMKIPGTAPKRIKASTLSIDIMPTILDSLKIVGPGNLEGRSLLPLIAGQAIQRDEFSFSHGEARMDAIWNSEWKLRFFDPAVPDPVLFHISDDPLEKVDVSDENPKIVARLKNSLSAFRAKRLSN